MEEAKFQKLGLSIIPSRHNEQASDEAYAAAFRRDVSGLWALAILLPLALTGLCKLVL